VGQQVSQMLREQPHQQKMAAKILIHLEAIKAHKAEVSAVKKKGLTKYARRINFR
jgi:hypothetical protein